MADRAFKPLGGSQTQGVTCIRASWTVKDLGSAGYGPDKAQQDGIHIGSLYVPPGESADHSASQGFYLGRFAKVPYETAALTPHYDQNDWYKDILGVEFSYGASGTPSVDNRLTFEITNNFVDAPLVMGGSQYTFAPVFSVRHLSMDGTPATKEDLLGKVVHMTVWLKNSDV